MPLAALLLNQLGDVSISSVWLFEHFGHFLDSGGLQVSLPSYLSDLSFVLPLLLLVCKLLKYSLETSQYTNMLLECTHCSYNVCLLYFRVFVQSLSCSLLCNCVYSYGMCMYNAVSGLVCCIPLYYCDTTPTSSTSFSINLT